MDNKKILGLLLITCVLFYSKKIKSQYFSFNTFSDNIFKSSFPRQINLFEGDSILSLTIKCNLYELIKDREEERQYHEGLLIIHSKDRPDHVIKIKLKTRGIFRRARSNCYFPPFLIKFEQAKTKNSLFEGLEKLKLVLPCYKSDNGQDYVFLEYLAYKIYNLITDYSFKVRLAKITFVDLSGKSEEFTKYTFFIEPIAELEKRMNAKELKAKNIHPELTDRKLINLLAIYQYMIGNTDWSVRTPHNIKLLSRDSLQKPVAIPYDFDFAGMVNTPYAHHPEFLKLNSILIRSYYGYYRTYPELEENIKIFRDKRNDIYELVNNFNLLSEKERKITIKYFEQFNKIINDKKKASKEFIENCRKDWFYEKEYFQLSS